MNPSDAAPATLFGLLSSIPAERTAIIHVDGNIRVTYGELRQQVETVAEALAASGVGRRERLGVPMPAARAVYSCAKLLDERKGQRNVSRVVEVVR